MIGTVRSSDEEGFTFISRERLPRGMFVCYTDAGKKILCRVKCSEPLNQYPQEFLLDMNIEADEVSGFYGLDPADFKYYSYSAAAIGYFDAILGEFINPRTNPACGQRIEHAGSDILKDISKLEKGESGSAFIGTVLGAEADIVLSVRDMVSQHISVIASTGAGKSYTVGVLVEELLKPCNMAPVLIFDPHGEYSSLNEISNMPEFITSSYRPRVKIVKPEHIKIRVGDLLISDFISIMDDGTMSDKMKTLFRSAYNNLKNNHKKQFMRNELKQEIEALRDSNNDPTIEGILWRFGKLYAPIFDDFQTIPLAGYFMVGQLTVMDVSGIEETYQQLIASIMLRRLFDAKEGTENNRYNESHIDKFLPYPVFVIIEEAHRFAPHSGEAKSKSILKTILSEGRKFGIGICMVSQRPSKLDADSLSQCMTQITMRIINPGDQQQIAQSIETASRDLISELPSLAKGQAIISGVAINTPTLVRIRKRLTSDIKGRSKDAPMIWQAQRKYEEKHQAQEVRADREMDIGV
ncbi:putative ATPase [Candidatus Methanoperedens nitroreducens]|uniref:Putative ATPase n=1 Tax=Candidatus Methanoperedens nitratireducens TaxID=1392998 RepID=A0A062UYC2_9EURY|nr:ATP-binding protein [Candidatus Methanoperedens nitroreducens]KCZ71921.1 putative ATPase [Candidatus Methanoperedens nitroreducens]MDJ1422104.1 ATP-binding protein [Candidatus Methanoperedens sp.]